MSNITERSHHDVERTFETTGVHRLAQIDRKYDPFEGEIDPVTITATDPVSGETIAHFHLDENGTATNLAEPAPEPDLAYSSHATEPGLVPAGRSTAQEFESGVSLNDALAFIEAKLDGDYPIESHLKAWTTDDGTITKLGIVSA